MIANFQDITSSAVDIMNSCHELAESSVTQFSEAKENYNAIADSVKSISDMATQIATAAEEQSLVNNEINQNTIAIKETSTDFTNEFAEYVNKANDLRTQSAQLRDILGEFKT